MDMFRFIAGIISLIGGIGLIVVSFFIWPFVIYAIILIVVGILLLLNSGHEERIEKVKSKNLPQGTIPITKRHKKKKK